MVKASSDGALSDTPVTEILQLSESTHIDRMRLHERWRWVAIFLFEQEQTTSKHSSHRYSRGRRARLWPGPTAARGATRTCRIDTQMKLDRRRLVRGFDQAAGLAAPHAMTASPLLARCVMSERTPGE